MLPQYYSVLKLNNLTSLGVHTEAKASPIIPSPDANELENLSLAPEMLNLQYALIIDAV